MNSSQVLHFWFETLRSEDWYRSDVALDDFIRDRLAAAHDLAVGGRLASWPETPEGMLALIILLDQVPRNIFRGLPRAFASDEMARDLLAQALAAGQDKMLTRRKRAFLYLPLMHSETLADQAQSVALFSALGLENNLDHAVRHRDVISRFGRFPHRNAVLVRKSSSGEEEYLSQPGAGF
jgi:uncharacterized protein (DUF924 family)